VRLVALLAAVVLGVLAVPDPGGSGPVNFIFFNRDRHRIADAEFLATGAVAGALLKYTWRELEPERDRYVLESVGADLAFLRRHGKRLFIQIQDVTFDETVNVPDYLRSEPVFNGGVARKYEAGATLRFDGWVARRWDPVVRARFASLLAALGRELDGSLEGVVLPETAIAFGDRRDLIPSGFTPEAYVDGVKDTMTAARKAFASSRVIQYANFMPGEWLPSDDRGYLRSVYEHAARVGVGVGGPDLLPHRRGQRNHSYPLIAARVPGMVAGVAVQAGNLGDVNPATRERVTAEELYRFATRPLRLTYLFWGTEEPYYSAEVLPLLRRLGTGSATEGARR
jgi:hypothetical protein